MVRFKKLGIFRGKSNGNNSNSNININNNDDSINKSRLNMYDQQH